MHVTVLDDSVLGGLRSVDVAPSDWEELDACPVCGSADALHDVGMVRGRRRAAVLAACDGCQHGFLRRRPTTHWLERFYAEEWDTVRQDGGKVAAPKPPDPKARDFCAGALNGGARVLDVGAGFGRQLLALQGDGHEVLAVEPSPHRARYLEEALGISCLGPTIDSVADQDPFDLVIAHHVLEHVAAPETLVARVSELLRPGGHFYVAVPNLWEELSAQSMHFVPHLAQYTLRSLARLLAGHGLYVERAREGVDLQVLARLGGPPVEPPEGRDDFLADLAAWVAAGFGGREGRHAIVWRKDPGGSALYSYERLPGNRARHLLSLRRRVDRLHNRRLRRWARARLPDWTGTRSVRVLGVDVRRPLQPPVEVVHERREAPVWVK